MRDGANTPAQAEPDTGPGASLRGRRVLQLVHSDDKGGVEALAEMVAAGLTAHGAEVATKFMYADARAGRLAKLVGMVRTAGLIFGARPDALIAYQSTASVIVALAGRLARVPVRLVHQTAMPEGVHPLVRRLDRWAGAAGLYTANVVNSNACAAEFAGYPARYRDSLVLLPHGLPPLPPPLPADRVRARHGIPRGRPVILTAGRLSRQKAHERIIAALPNVPDTHLVIAGGGPRARELIELSRAQGLEKRVTLTGPLERAAVADLLAIADAFVFPSRWETFGLAPVEAAMAGVPLVVSDLPVLREVLTAGDAAAPVRFVDAEDPTELAAAITAALQPQARAAARAYAPDIVSRHRPEPMIDAYARLVAGERL